MDDAEHGSGVPPEFAALSHASVARLARLAPVMRAADDGRDMGALCGSAAAALSVTGASVMLLVGGAPAPLAWSDEVAQTLESLQNTLGEGPCVDAHDSGHAISEPDLLAPMRLRWPAFSPAALEAGAGAVFSFPLGVGAARIGALTLFRRTPGPLTPDQLEDAQTVADITTTVVLAMQWGAPEGSVAAGLEMVADYGAVVHQASGIVSVQLGIGVADALMRLRAHAFLKDRPITDVAADIVARRLRLEE